MMTEVRVSPGGKCSKLRDQCRKAGDRAGPHMSDHTSGRAGTDNGQAPPVSQSGAAAAAPSAATPASAPPPAPAPPPAAADRHPILNHTEAIAKLATLVLGLLYVFGLLISNIQFIDLGISDFASLQARNMLTGVSFVLYFGVMLVLLALVYIICRMPYEAVRIAIGKEPSFFLLQFDKLPRSRKGRLAVVLTTFSFAVYILIRLVREIGRRFELLYPWGPQPPAADFASALDRFADAYVSDSNGTAAFFLLGMAFLLPPLFAQTPNGPDEAEDKKGRDIQIVLFSLLLGGTAVWAALIGYAKDIYPNIAYNYGGGQPGIAALALSGKKSDLAAMDNAAAPLARLCCDDPNSEQSVKTSPMVIWYQSDKFIHVSNLAGVDPNAQPAPAHVVAVDLKLVRSIEYLPRYIEIHGGSKFARVYERKPDGTIAVMPPTPAAAAPGAAVAPR
jgi:hypothetical protein